MDRLWTPWRYSYITRSDPQAVSGVPAALSAWPPNEAENRHCVFCNMIAAVDYAIEHGMEEEAAEKAAHIIYRGKYCFICLNAFPYSTGHMLLLPYQHLDTLAGLPTEVAQELIGLAQRSSGGLSSRRNQHGTQSGRGGRRGNRRSHAPSRAATVERRYELHDRHGRHAGPSGVA
jgi:ATP adenylyltransferase